ncbi:hypothetical protein CVS28_03805 [Arthrobacter glacialis]|nr:hypothetical protein CVS28_03805 [Arthrobacter glacialis]
MPRQDETDHGQRTHPRHGARSSAAEEDPCAAKHGDAQPCRGERRHTDTPGGRNISGRQEPKQGKISASQCHVFNFDVRQGTNIKSPVALAQARQWRPWCGNGCGFFHLPIFRCETASRQAACRNVALRYDPHVDQMADVLHGRYCDAGRMTIAIYAQLAVLALIDSTSIGTLLIPLWLFLRPDAKRLMPRILLYLGALAGFYLVIGVAVLSGASWLLGGLSVDSLAQIPVVQWSMSIAGVLMLGYALFAGSGKKPAAVGAANRLAGTSQGGAGAQIAEDASTGRRRWQNRIASALESRGGIVALALIAGVLELPTMLPYLAAIGFLVNSTLPLAGELTVLAIYCVVMLIPALVLLGLRVGLGARLDPFLHRVSNKLGKFSAETVLWVVGIVGFLLLRSGLSYLAPLAAWNPFK